ncbi:terminase small subunit [Fulvimarina endophytica]|uniref:Terminase small subunit n=1 Tax=Fulvimarina endophytica TaxID=2293836 RepID=A0A371X717_9HYPH|nr:terminase small subunit [Fulvimarina endophytica]RFC65006.1 terminase small subunit [Fulvimarina endophytica]
MTDKLTPKQARFVEEYLVDLNATQASIRAGYSDKTAYSIGHELLGKPEIQAAIAAAQTARSERTEITADMVLQHWWAIATAEANELSQLRRVNCRHCWGENHGYQWREGEYQIACDEAVKAEKALPDEAGGFGFDPTRPAHPDCPECAGEGEEAVFFADTRKLTGAARKLYAGVKKTKDGLELKTRDQDKAMELVARHLGMFVDKSEVEVKHAYSELSDDELAAEIDRLQAQNTPKG